MPPDQTRIKIKQYIVERREDGKKAWQKCAVAEKTYADITGLLSNHSYEFRICSEDFHGNRSVFVRVRDEMVSMGRVISKSKNY